MGIKRRRIINYPGPLIGFFVKLRTNGKRPSCGIAYEY
jgi:hypothetical protein